MPGRGQLRRPGPDRDRGRATLTAGSLPPGLTLPATFTGAGDIVGGTPTDPGVVPGRNFTVQGTGDLGQPLYQAYTLLVDQNLPLAINASGGSTLFPGTVGTAYAQNFFVSGGAAPYTFTMRLTDYDGQQATQQFILTINP